MDCGSVRNEYTIIHCTVHWAEKGVHQLSVSMCTSSVFQTQVTPRPTLCTSAELPRTACCSVTTGWHKSKGRFCETTRMSQLVQRDWSMAGGAEGVSYSIPQCLGILSSAKAMTFVSFCTNYGTYCMYICIVLYVWVSANMSANVCGGFWCELVCSCMQCVWVHVCVCYPVRWIPQTLSTLWPH